MEELNVDELAASTEELRDFTAFEWVYHCLSEGLIDFDGQRWCYDLQAYIIYGFGAFGFLHGLIVSSFQLTLIWLCVGFGVALVFCLPSWPMYNRDPIHWQPPRTGSSLKVERDLALAMQAQEEFEMMATAEMMGEMWDQAPNGDRFGAMNGEPGSLADQLGSQGNSPAAGEDDSGHFPGTSPVGPS